MDMTKDYLDRTLELAEPHTIAYEDRLFVDKDMCVLPKEPIVKDTLRTSSLSSIVDYIRGEVDNRAIAGGRLIVHVEGSKAVTVYRELNQDKKRDCLISAAPLISSFPFGRFMDVESFIINLQANFVQDENTAALLAFVGSVKTDTGVEQNDDGISQKVTARSGVSLVTSAKVPNPISLRPYRTFSEVEQPESPFVFRVKSEERAGVSMALFEADGKAWEHIPGAREVKGSDPPEVKSRYLSEFTNGSLRCLVTKPSIAGFGLNWQGCARMVFVGLSDSFERMYQAIRRCWRFGQKRDVRVHIVTSEAEGAVRENIARKEQQALEMVREMVGHTQEILREEIQGTVRQIDRYDPKVDMVLPLWVRRTA